MEFSIKTVKHEPRRLGAGSKTRIYVWPKDESVMENLTNRRDRPVEVWRPIALAAANMCGLHPKGRTVAEVIAWSQKAGCSCGCSPGFIVKGPWRPGFDIHVTVS